MRTVFLRTPHVVLGILTAAILVGCSPMSGYVNNERGSAYYRAGNYQAAMAEFNRAVADSPHNSDYLHNLATAQSKGGDVVAAEQTYRRSLQTNPDHQPSYHGLASLLLDQNRVSEAQDLTQMWVDTQPYNAEPYIEMAWVQRKLGDYAGAERTLQHAMTVEPSNSMVTAQLGQIYQDQGRSADATALYRRSLAKNWHQPEVKQRLAQMPPSAATGSPVTQQAYYTGGYLPENRRAAGQPRSPIPAPRAALLYPLPTYRRSGSTPALAAQPGTTATAAQPSPTLVTQEAPAIRPF